MPHFLFFLRFADGSDDGAAVFRSASRRFIVAALAEHSRRWVVGAFATLRQKQRSHRFLSQPMPFRWTSALFTAAGFPMFRRASRSAQVRLGRSFQSHHWHCLQSWWQPVVFRVWGWQADIVGYQDRGISVLQGCQWLQRLEAFWIASHGVWTIGAGKLHRRQSIEGVHSLHWNVPARCHRTQERIHSQHHCVQKYRAQRRRSGRRQKCADQGEAGLSVAAAELCDGRRHSQWEVRAHWTQWRNWNGGTDDGQTREEVRESLHALPHGYYPT